MMIIIAEFLRGHPQSALGFCDGRGQVGGAAQGEERGGTGVRDHRRRQRPRAALRQGVSPGDERYSCCGDINSQSNEETAEMVRQIYHELDAPITKDGEWGFYCVFTPFWMCAGFTHGWRHRLKVLHNILFCSICLQKCATVPDQFMIVQSEQKSPIGFL